VIEAVAEAVQSALGYTTVVFNLYRPEWDDYAAVLVLGSPTARRILLGTTSSREVWHSQLLSAEFERQPGVFFIADDDDSLWENIEEVYVPDIAPTQDPETWTAEDALLVAMRSTRGEPLGILSVDEPETGRRPTDDDLQILGAVAAHLSLALENARAADLAAWHRRTLADLLRVSSQLAVGRTTDEVLGHVCATIVPRLGFEKVAVYIRDEDELHLTASAGWEADPGVIAPPIALADLRLALEEHPGEEGCHLIKRERLRPAEAQARDPYRSPRNGRGPLAWSDHWLLVPMRERRGDLTGVLVVDDPISRLAPAPEHRQALRLLCDQAVAAVESMDRQTSLRRMASFDPLTGVRNRRGLESLIEGLVSNANGVALMVCDLDEFKSVNDRFGHEVGDHVLERFGALLRAHARTSDIAVRLGGEEFCLVLPGAGAEGAMAVAERLRLATVERMQDLAPGVTVSIGVAASADEENVRELLNRADMAMYEAKAAGRNRSHAAV
jgi:diguanylate cyclase (GGDEF)-like protein